MRPVSLALILVALLCPALVAAGPGDGYGYGPPAARPDVRIYPTAEGYALTWLVTEDADGWRVLVRGSEVWRASYYLDPGFVARATIPLDAWAPGAPLSLCVTWLPPAEPLEQCFDLTGAPRYGLYLPAVQR